MTMQRWRLKVLRFWLYSSTLITVCCLAFVSIWQPRSVSESKNSSWSGLASGGSEASPPVAMTFLKASTASRAALLLRGRGTSFTATPGIHAMETERTRSSLIPKSRLPECLIVGVRKAGTRALLEFLSLHPSIVTSKKETHFFDSDENYRKGLEWYLKFMPPSLPGQITIEKTPAYFLSRKVPPRIRLTLQPSIGWRMKFLVVVKDPIERALSDYVKVRTSKLKLGIQYLTFEELSTDPITGNLTSMYKPIIRSLYSLQLRNWMEHFAIDQFLFVNGETLIRDPASELERVELFLNLPRFLTSEKFLWNETRGFYCMLSSKRRVDICSRSKNRNTKTTSRRRSSVVDQRTTTTTATSTIETKLFSYESVSRNPTRKCGDTKSHVSRRVSKAGNDSNEVRCLSPSKGLKHPTLDPFFSEKLKQFFEPYNLEFYKMTGINFGW